MPLNNSGQISMGGSTTGQSINLELGKSATAQISLNDSNARTLAGIASGQISLSNFYGKSYIVGTFSWGNNLYGQLGLDDITNRSSPTQITYLITGGDATRVFASTQTSFAIRGNTLWVWGRFDNNRISGLNILDPYLNRSSPTQIGTLTNWKTLTTSQRTSLVGLSQNEAAFAIKTDGTLWYWGDSYGSGLSGFNYSSPVQIGSETNWDKFSSGGAKHVQSILKTNNTLWAWGFQGSDLIGNVSNDATYTCTLCIPYAANLNGHSLISSPVQISTSVKYASSGTSHGMFIKTDDTLWGWGDNTQGQINNTNNNPAYYTVSDPNIYGPFGCVFNSNVANRSYERHASQIFNLACCADNQCSNFYQQSVTGELVAANTMKWGFSSPVQIGSNTWSRVSAGLSYTLGIRTNGTLWAWGSNGFGKLGLGDTTSRSSPTQIGSGTDWARVYAGSNVSFAIKTNGTLWTWGNTPSGAISSPVQVGSQTNWATDSNFDEKFAVGSDFQLGILS